MTALLQLDKAVFSWINAGWSNPVLDVLMPMASRSCDAVVVWLWIALIGLLMARRLARSAQAPRGPVRSRSARKAIGLLCLYLALVYGVNAGAYSAIKHLVHRPRPFVQQSVILRVPAATASHLYQEGSFPSGHACNAFMIAVLLAGQFRRKRFVFYGLASVVAASRVYLGVHYPADVAAGACLGYALTRAMLAFGPFGKGGLPGWAFPLQGRAGPAAGAHGAGHGCGHDDGQG